MTKVEQLQVQPDQLAKVVIDESSGIIVIGKDVKINRLAIAQGNPDHQNLGNSDGFPAPAFQ